MADRRAASLAAPAAAFLLGAWAVAACQSFVTYNRLMVATWARARTPLESSLLVAGLALAAAAVVVAVVRRRSGHPRRPPPPAVRLGALTAFLVGSYGVAVVQWYEVLHQATGGRGVFHRDPTLVEDLLLVAAAVSAAAWAVVVLDRRRTG